MKNYKIHSLKNYINFLIDNKLTSKHSFNRNILYKNFEFYLNNTFQDIDFKDKNVLDIGSGNGIFSFYAKICGARKVICLEPSLDGSSNNNNYIFNLIKKNFKFKDVTYLAENVQDYITYQKFDLIILKDSINHIDEESCINLKKSNIFKNNYINLFNKIYGLMSTNANIFISDCSNKNFFDDLNLKNPFVSDIEWFKHQDPNEWIKLMKITNYNIDSLKWSSINSLRFLKNFNNNKIISYFTSSNFRIIASKK